jgi:hypothetical protein
MALDPITALLDFGSKVIERIFPDPSQAAQAKLELFKMQQSGELAAMAAEVSIQTAQIKVNEESAKSSSLWVSGARPFILWGCGFAMLYAAMFEPIMRFVAVVCFAYAGNFPALDTTLTTQVLLGLLGLSGMRTLDKIKGVSSK